MTRTVKVAMAMALACAVAAHVSAQTKGGEGSLGSVTLARKVMADGKPLAAGTYAVRVSADPVTPVSGQPAGSEKWVEFVQANTVKGRELATVYNSADIKTVQKETPPASGEHRVEMLKGDEYLRVWINQGGTHYLVHLSVAK